MRIIILIFLTFFCSGFLSAQVIDPDLLEIKNRLEQISEAKASAELLLDIEFIKMPEKFAELHFVKGKPISYTSDNFIIIPKRGLDFSWNELFKHEFMTVDRGTESENGQTLKMLNIIPLDKKADFAIMTMKINPNEHQIYDAEITTKNEGTYHLIFQYKNGIRFPSKITVEFEIEKIRIPLNFMGKDAEIDKEKLKGDDPKKGKIMLTLDWREVQLTE